MKYIITLNYNEIHYSFHSDSKTSKNKLNRVFVYFQLRLFNGSMELSLSHYEAKLIDVI